MKTHVNNIKQGGDAISAFGSKSGITSLQTGLFKSEYPSIEKIIILAKKAESIKLNDNISRQETLEIRDSLKTIINSLHNIMRDNSLSYLQKKEWLSAAAQARHKLRELCQKANNAHYLVEVDFLLDANDSNFNDATTELYKKINKKIN